MRGKDRTPNRGGNGGGGSVSTAAAAADSSAGDGGCRYRVGAFPTSAPISSRFGLLPGLDSAELRLVLRSPMDVLMAVSHVLVATMAAGLPNEDSWGLACHVISIANSMGILFSEEEVNYLRQMLYPLTLTVTPVTIDGAKIPRKAEPCDSDDTTYVCSPSTTSSDCNSSLFANTYIRPIALSPSKTVIENFTERLAVGSNAMPSIQASKRSAFYNLSPATPTSRSDTKQAISCDGGSFGDDSNCMEYPATPIISSKLRKQSVMPSQATAPTSKESGPQPNSGGAVRPIKSKRRQSRKWTKEEDDSVRQLVEDFGAGNWVKIAKALGTKSPKQIHARWRDYLRPELNPDLPWTEEETVKLAHYHSGMGNAWAELARLFPCRSANSIKNKVNAAKRRRRAPGDQSSGGDKLWDYLHTQAAK